MPSRQTWDERCRRLHEALKQSGYTATDWAREMGIPRARLYTEYGKWKARKGVV